MRPQTAARVADVMIAAAAVSAAWLVLRDRRGRQLAGGLLRAFVTTHVPRFLAREIRTAWEATA